VFCRRPDERRNGDPEDSVVKEPYAGGVVRSFYCKFYDLVDALIYMATGTETRSFYKTVHAQGHVSVGLDGTVKGWQEDFYECVSLKGLTKDNFKRIGGVNRVNHVSLIVLKECESYWQQQVGHYFSAGDLVGSLSEKVGHELGLPAGIAVGSGVIDAYADWVATVAAKVDLGVSYSEIQKIAWRKLMRHKHAGD
jgi:ribulose kinase